MDRKKNGLPLDAVIALVLMLFVLVLAFEGLAVQKLPEEATGFPVFVFAVIFVVGCLELLRIRRGQKKEHQESQSAQNTPKAVFHNRKNFLVMCGLIIGYIVFMSLVGFILATILFTVVFAVKFHYGHPAIFGVIAVFVTIGLYYIFKNVMYIQLPAGFLFDLIS